MEEQTFSDRAGIGGRNWDSAPEVRARRRPKAQPESQEPEGENVEAAYYRDQLEQVGEAAAEANEQVLDALAWETDFSEIKNPVEIMDNLLAAGGGVRMEDALTSWMEHDPYTATAWLTDRQSRAATAYGQQAYAEAERLQAEQADARLKTIADFITDADNPILAAQVAESALGSPAAPSEIEAVLPKMYERGEEVKRVSEQASALRDLRNSFRSSGLGGPSTLDPRTGKPLVGEPLGDPTESMIAARMRPPAEHVQAQREQAVEEMRSDFADAARGSGFGEGNREGAARAEKARDEEKLKPRLYHNRSPY